MFSNFKELDESAKSSDKPFTVIFLRGSYFSSIAVYSSLASALAMCCCSTSNSSSLVSSSGTPSKSASMSILIHTQIKVACHLNDSLTHFCILLILGKSFAVMAEPLECILPDAIHALHGDINTSPSKFLDAVMRGGAD